MRRLPLPGALFAEYERAHSRRATRITHMFGIPLVVLSVPVALFAPLLGLKMFLTGWALQFVGHYVFEKNSPKFFGDPRHLIVGVIWSVREWQRLLQRRRR